MVTEVEVVHRNMCLNMYTSIGGSYSPTLAFWAGMRLAKIAAFPRIRRTESLVKALLICSSSSPPTCLALAVASFLISSTATLSQPPNVSATIGMNLIPCCMHSSNAPRILRSKAKVSA